VREKYLDVVTGNRIQNEFVRDVTIIITRCGRNDER